MHQIALDYEVIMGVETLTSRVEFGSMNIEPVPYSELAVLTQTRKTYIPEGIEELAASIEGIDEMGIPHFELLHPPLVNIISTSEQAQQYVDDLNLCHGATHTLKDVPQRVDGGYAIVVAGHRRRLAIGTLLDKYQQADVLVPCNAQYDLTFIEALRKQIDENTHNALPVHEQAQAIQAIYKYGIAKGDYTSMMDCVRDLPFGEEKVRNALRYCELPEFLQEWVADGHVPYGAAVALHPLMAGLRNRYADKPVEEREAIIDNYLRAYGVKIMDHGWGREMVSTQVKNLLASMNGVEELQLFQTDELLVSKRVERQAVRELFHGGIGRLRQFRDLGLFERLPTEYREAVREELQKTLLALGETAVPQMVEQPLL